MKTNRLFFIDTVRAFAIIMMLQGHFIDTLLDPEYKDSSNSIFQIWCYFRGITAPTFFTISGLIFTYLLMKSKKKGLTSERIHKGLSRSLLLIVIGYGLRIPILEWFTGVFKTYFLIVDVLQVIGLSIFLIIIFYLITLKKTVVFSVLMLLLGLLTFFTEPWHNNIDTSKLPLIISNYLTQSNGSIFTILPWIGYIFFGAFIASLFYRFLDNEKFKPVLVCALILIGTLFIYNSSQVFMWIYRWSDILIFKQVAYSNYLFTRLGNVLILLSLFYALERFMKNEIIFKIGQKTLSIYIVHFFIIYGSLTGLGLSQLIGKTLNPYQAGIGALLFIIVVCLISLYGIRTNTFIYKKLRSLITQNK